MAKSTISGSISNNDNTDAGTLASAKAYADAGDSAEATARASAIATAKAEAIAAAEAGTLLVANDLSDLHSASTARTNLGLGTAATTSASAYDPAGSAATAQGNSLQKSSNLSDLASATTARTNLGLGTAATHAATDFDAAGAASTAQSAAVSSSLQKTSNLSDLGSASTARTNLGLGTAATHDVGFFDLAGAAATAQAAAIAASDPAGSAATAQSAAIAAAATNTTSAVAAEATARATAITNEVAARNTAITSSLSGYVQKGTHYINIGDYCVLDGVTDDSAAFQTMLSTFGSGYTYRFPNGLKKLLVKTPLTMNLSNVVLEGTSPSMSQIVMDSSLNLSLSSALNINTSPTFGTQYSVVTNVQKGDTAIKVSPSDSTNFSPGQYFLLRSSEQIDTNTNNGEYHIVKSVDTANGLIFLQERVYDQYLLTNSPNIISCTFLHDVTVRNIGFYTNVTGSSAQGTGTLWARCVDRFLLDNCSFHDLWYIAFDMTSCLNSTVTNMYVDHVQTSSASQTVRYGIALYSANHNIYVQGVWNRCRHSVTTGAHSGTNHQGKNRNIKVVGTSTNADTAHFDTHMSVDGMSYDVTCDGGISYLDPAAANVNGVQVRGKNVDVKAVVKNILGNAVSVQGDSLHNAENVKIQLVADNIMALRVMTYALGQVTLSSTPFSVNVVDASQFASSGTAFFTPTDKFTYTGKSGNTLTGCTSSQTTVWPDGSSVAQNSSGGYGVQFDSACLLGGMEVHNSVISNTDGCAIKGEGGQTDISIRGVKCKNNTRLSSLSTIHFNSLAGIVRISDCDFTGGSTNSPVTLSGSNGHTVQDNDWAGFSNPVPTVSGAGSTVFNNKGYNPIGYYDNGSVSTSTAISRTNGDYQLVTATGDVTLTKTGTPTVGDQLTLQLVQDGTGNHTWTMASPNFVLADGTTTLKSPASAIDMITFVWTASSVWQEKSRALSSTHPAAINRSVVSISTNTTGANAFRTDYSYFCTATLTFTLPTAVSNTNRYTVTNSGSGTVTVNTTSAQTINGTSSVTISPGSSLSFDSDNANWSLV